MSKIPLQAISKPAAVFLAAIVCCSLIPLNAAAEDVPKGSLSIKAITVEPSQVRQGETASVTLKCSYSAPTNTSLAQWICLAGILVYDGQGKLVYGDLSHKERWEGYKSGLSTVDCGAEGAAGTFTEQIPVSTSNLNPGPHTFNLEIYGSQREPGLGQAYWTMHHFTDRRSFTLTVLPAAAPSKPPASVNNPPVASFSITPASPTTGDRIQTSNTSADPDGDTLTFRWYVDGELLSSSENWYTDKPNAGSYTVELIVEDGRGGADKCTKTLTVNATKGTTQPSAPQMAVYAKPSYFQAVGDEVNLTVKITDGNGAPLAGELIQLVHLDPGGTSVSDHTDSAGEVRFILIHVSDQLSVYNYSAQAAGLERRFQIPVIKADIRIEQNPGTGKPYQGVVADGASSLKILIDIPHLSGGEITFVYPQAGTLEGKAIAFRGHLLLDKDGRAEITYHPPKYLEDNSKLTVQHTPHGRIGYPAWSMTEEIVFSFKNAAGQEESVPLAINVFRPPVMLVHGFIGDKTTWANLAQYLAAEKYDPVVREYTHEYTSSNDTSIQALSGLLQRYINEQKQDYLNSDVRITKVDIVGHSMGGLISRHYIKGMPSYEKDVRKLIMVGTPNHGASSWLDQAASPQLAEWYDRHQIASVQLHSDSEFILNLNRREATGQHLDMNVEYANIIGRRTRIISLPGSPYAFDDGIVSINSAQLNGVTQKTYLGTVHSTALPGDVSLTEHKGVWEQIRIWLITEIFRPPLQGSSMQITRGEGDVSIHPVTGAWKKLTAYPLQIEPWYGIRTGLGKATITLTLNNILWGMVNLDQDTELIFDYASPELVRVLLKKGSARFRSGFKDKSGHFNVIMGQEGYKWYEFQPRARVISMGTDFTVQAGEIIQTYVLEGEVGVVSYSAATGVTAQALSPRQGTIITSEGKLEMMASPPTPWWENKFYTESSSTSTLSTGSNADTSCCIAASAYGSAAAAELNILRQFRDRFLSKTAPGRCFIENYYRYSPPAARFLAHNEMARILARDNLVAPAVRLVKASEQWWQN